MARPIDRNLNAERFESIERAVLAQEIAERILRLLQEGRLAPGEKLPPERKLSSLLGVSRPSLREALRALQLMNIVEIRPGDGTYVSSLEPEQLVEPLRLLLLLQDVTYLELLEARRTIEPAIAALAAQRISESELTQLDSCLSKAKEFIDDPPAFLRADLELHSVIVEASHNPLLISIMASINHLGVATRRRTSYIPGVREKVLKHHARIVEALHERDPKASWEAMEKHLSDVEEALHKVIKETGSLEDFGI